MKKNSIRAEDLFLALRHFRRVIEQRSTIPILSHVRLTSKGGKLHIVGTDLDTQLSTAIPHRGEVFDVAVNLDRVLSALEAEGASDIRLSADDRKFVVAGQSHYTFATLPAGDMHSVATKGKTVSFELDAPLVDRMLADVAPAISTEDVRYYLNGVYIERIADSIGFTTTDGHRLHMARAKVPEGFPAFKGVILPRRTVRLLRELIEAAADNATRVSFDIAEHLKMRVVLGDWTIITKLIDGSFPDYTRVIPTDHAGSITTHAADVFRAASSTAAICTQKTRGLIIRAGDGLIEADNGENAQVSCALKIAIKGKPPATIGFNAEYLRQIVTRRPNHSVVARMGDEAAPTLFEFEDDDSFSAVLMPMRIP